MRYLLLLASWSASTTMGCGACAAGAVEAGCGGCALWSVRDPQRLAAHASPSTATATTAHMRYGEADGLGLLLGVAIGSADNLGAFAERGKRRRRHNATV